MSKSVLKSNVLVLNKSWAPVNVTNVESAIGLIFRDKANVVVHENLLGRINGDIVCFQYELLNYKEWVKRSEVTSDDYSYIHSARHRHIKPAVIILENYRGYPRYKIKLSRRGLYNRDEGKCQYCGKEVSFSEFQREHVHPQSRGGRTEWNNIVVSCPSCNDKKRDKTLHEARMALIKKPVRPSEVNFQKIYAKEYETWKGFLGSRNE